MSDEPYDPLRKIVGKAALTESLAHYEFKAEQRFGPAPKLLNKTDNPTKSSPGVGMPAALLLNEFGSQVWFAFGSLPYQVGSSLFGKTWRDVDVRMMLDDEEWDRMELGDPDHCHQNGKWVAMCRAFSALGVQMTGLPIDFQLQKTSHANQQFGGNEHPRSALGTIPLRMAKYKETQP